MSSPRPPFSNRGCFPTSMFPFLNRNKQSNTQGYVKAITSAMSSPKAFSISRSDLKDPTSSVTLITGGAGGIGLQTALLLHDISPTNKIIILDRQQPNIQQAPQAFIESNRVLTLQCDLTSWSSQREAFEAGFQRFGAIDNVFVNAGIAEYKDQFFNDGLDEQGKLREPDRRVYDVDLAAANDTVKLAIYYMRKKKDAKGGGSIVLTASLAGYLASAGAPLYSAAKHGSLHSFLILLIHPSSTRPRCNHLSTIGKPSPIETRLSNPSNTSYAADFHFKQESSDSCEPSRTTPRLSTSRSPSSLQALPSRSSSQAVTLASRSPTGRSGCVA